MTLSCILVVDDSSTMRKIIARNLEQTPLTVGKILFAGDGHEALEMLEMQSVDVVLTDLNMPGLDGVGLVRAMRAKGLQAPVVVLSTSESHDAVEEALASGAIGFVPKPFSPEKLAEALQPLLAGK